MTNEIINGIEVYRDFMHQTEVLDLEELAEGEIEFDPDALFNARMAVLYDVQAQAPLACSHRSFLYILSDIRGILGQSRVDSVLIRQVPYNGLPQRRSPARTGATLLMPIGPFDGGLITIRDTRIAVGGGNCIVVPQDATWSIQAPTAGKMYLVSAHGVRK